MALRPMAKGLISCEIGNGKQASFWLDNWTTHGPLIDFIGPSGPNRLGIPITATVVYATNSAGWRLPSARTRSQGLLALEIP